jgi:hypothetical protein
VVDGFRQKTLINLKLPLVEHGKNLFSAKSTACHFSSELTVGFSKPFWNFVGDMLFGIEASPDRKLGKPKTVSITAHFKERLNSITGATPAVR